jgi:hypothetical protein
LRKEKYPKESAPGCRALHLRSAASGLSWSDETSCLDGPSRASVRATLRASAQSLAVLGRDRRAPSFRKQPHRREARYNLRWVV